MKLTKEEIRARNITEYFILIDGINDDTIARCENMNDVKKEARLYDEECDGEWDPILVIYNRETRQCNYVEDWCY